MVRVRVSARNGDKLWAKARVRAWARARPRATARTRATHERRCRMRRRSPLATPVAAPAVASPAPVSSYE